MTNFPSHQQNAEPEAGAEKTPITVAVLNDFPVVVEGVAGLLAGDERIKVVETATLMVPGKPVDIALFDAFATSDSLDAALERLQHDERFARVVLYTWNVEPEQVRVAEEVGFDGLVSKQLNHDELADAMVRVAAGEHVVEPRPIESDNEAVAWPGREAGLSARESEVVTLITQGLTNDQIASNTMLSINSVKSYIRSAYHKMGVQRRSQAVLWGVNNGMAPRPERSVRA